MPTVRITIAFDAVRDIEILKRLDNARTLGQRSEEVRKALYAYYGQHGVTNEELQADIKRLERKLEQVTVMQSPAPTVVIESPKEEIDRAELKANLANSLSQFRH